MSQTPPSILLVVSDVAFGSATREALKALGSTPVIASAEDLEALPRMPYPAAVIDTVGIPVEQVLRTCRGLRAEVSDPLILLLVDPLDRIPDFGPPGALYDDFMLRGGSSAELIARVRTGLERVQDRHIARQRERERILAQVVAFSGGLGPFLGTAELFQRVGSALMNMPEVRGVYAATRSDGDSGQLQVQLELGSPAAPDAEVVRQVLTEGRIRTQVRRGDVICVVPLGSGPMGFLALRLSGVGDAQPALPLALAGLVSSAYASARLFESTKSRQLRLERGYLERHRQLARATAGLEQLSKVRDHFLAMLSHDLRSPLAVVLASCQVLEEGLAGELNARQKRSVGVIFRQCTRMTTMVEELLDNYRAGLSAVPEFAEEIDLGEIVRDTMRGYGEQFRDAGLVYEVRVEREVVVYANPSTVREVICNLVDNAMKHAREQIALRVSSDEDGERGILRVCDDGPGFPADMDALLSEKPEGESSSMGLRLCASILRRAGGALRLENLPGGGAEARIELPATSPRGEGLRLLVGCGDMDRMEELVDLLAAQWSVSGASHGEEILKQIRDGGVDLLILDTQLKGGRGGLELLADLKSDPALGVIPVLVICPPASAAEEERAHTLGALDVLSRPVNGRVLIEHVQRAAELAAGSEVGPAARTHDALTGLETPVAVLSRVIRLTEESRLAGVALPSIWVDVQDLHGINQRMGYAAGDQLLLWLSSLLKKAADPGAVVCRYTGARFVLILPGVDMGRAESICQALVREVRESRPRLGAHRTRVQILAEVQDLTADSRLFSLPGDADPPVAAQ